MPCLSDTATTDTWERRPLIRNGQRRVCWLAPSFPACRLACSQFDDLGRDLFLPHAPLCCLQRGELALGLGVGLRHRLHTRFVFGCATVTRAMATLRVPVV